MDKLPDAGYVRLAQIIGQDEVTEAQAAINRTTGKGPKRPRPAIPAVIPVGKSTWWEGVRTGRYPRGEKLSPHVTVWRVERIRDLFAEG